MKNSLLSTSFIILVIALPFQTEVIAQTNSSLSTIKQGANPTISSNPQYDSIYYWYYNEGWNLVYRFKDYNYNQQGLNLGWIRQFYNNNDWVNGNRLTNEYLQGYLIKSSLSQNWETNKWVNDDLCEYEYYENDSLKSVIYGMWNSSSWDTLVMFSYEYNIDSNYKKEIIKLLANPFYQVVYYMYNTARQLVQIIHWDYNGMSLVKSFQTDIEYNNNGKIVSILNQIIYGDEMIPSSLTTYTYVASNLIEEVSKAWNGTELQNSLKINYEYDNTNNLTLIEKANWIENAWIKYQQQFFTYDVNGNKLSEVNTSLFGGEFVKNDSTRYYFQSTLGLSEMGQLYQSIQIYPNPSNGLYIIEARKPINDIEVFNLQGELIYSNYSSNLKHIIDLTKLKSGVYIIRTENTNRSKIIKINDF